MRTVQVVKQKYQEVRKAFTREGMLDILSGGRFAFFEKVYRMGGGRPDLTSETFHGIQIPQVSRYVYLKSLAWNITEFRTCIKNINQEIFRNGADWEPNFDQRCAICETTFKEPVDECPTCRGKGLLTRPNTRQLKEFEEVIKDANLNGQTLLEVLRQVEEDLEIGDDAYILAPKRVITEHNGIPILYPAEIIRGDPDNIRIIADQKGVPGGLYYKCPTCGGVETITDRELAAVATCPNDNTPLLEVTHVAIYTADSGTPEAYYTKDECLHLSKYSPSLLYGYAPMLTLYNEALTLHHMDRRIRRRFETGRVEGFMTFPTRDSAGLQRLREEAYEKQQTDPNWFPWIPVDPENKAGPQYIQTLGTLGENQYLELKKELRERIGAFFGVSLIFMSDTSTSGGLNNEGLQITVTDRAVEFGQSILNNQAMPWLMKQYFITDFTYTLNSNEEQDDVADLEVEAKRIANALSMVQLGYVPTKGPDGEFVFEHDPEGAKELQAPAADSTQFPPIFNGTGTPTEPDEANDYVVQKALVISPDPARVLEAVKEGAMWTAFSGMSKSLIAEVQGVIIKAMSQPEGWSVKSIMDNLKDVVPKDKQANLRAIARTESTSIQNTARSLEFEKRDPEGKFKYKWIGPMDNRTTDICKSISKRSSGGVSIKELNKIVNEESRKGGFDARPWTPHINCRHTFRRVVG